MNRQWDDMVARARAPHREQGWTTRVPAFQLLIKDDKARSAPEIADATGVSLVRTIADLGELCDCGAVRRIAGPPVTFQYVEPTPGYW
jgi:hypothetical protein